MKAFKEIGLKKVFKYIFWTIATSLISISVFPQFRIFILKLFGAKIGKDTIIHKVKFFNLYRKGFSGFEVGNSCFIGEECLFDLADEITIGDNVTLAEGVTVITHLNVGFKDHPLQKYFPSGSGPVKIEAGTFVGARVTILSGVVIGEESFIGAASLVNKDIASRILAGGVPAKKIKDIC
jgi:acetyltransferase-like isoleucine patch superfamily enzyme